MKFKNMLYCIDTGEFELTHEIHNSGHGHNTN